MQVGTKALALAVIVVVAAVAVVYALGSGSEPTIYSQDDGPAPASGAAEAGPVSTLTTSEDAAADAADEAGRTEVAGATPDPSGARIALTGRLVRDAAPVVGAKLRYSATPRVELGGYEVAPRMKPGEGASTETDHDGRFRFLMPVNQKGLLLLEDSDLVFAEREGQMYRVPAAERDLDLGDVQVAMGGILAGIVQDRGGRALEGVQVRLNRGQSELLLGHSHTTETDGDGRFRFRGLVAASYQISTASPQHLPGSKVVELAESSVHEDILMVLDSGSSIWGRVLDDLGRPIEGAKVGAYRTKEVDGMITMRGLSQGESVETDASGSFELGGIQEDAVTVRAWMDGHRAESQPGVAKGTGDVVLRLTRHGVVEGKLVDTAGAPIAGSTVRAIPGEGRGHFIRALRGDVTTGADGSFRLDDVPAGAVTVEAQGDTHVDVRSSVEVQPGATTDGVRLVAARGATVEALVVDSAGEPVPDAEVEVKEAAMGSRTDGQFLSFSTTVERTRDEHGHEDVFIDDGSAKALGTATTGPDGIARIGGLPPGQVEVIAKHDQMAPSRPAPLTLAASGVTEAKLALREGGAAVLTVVDADGQPVPNATVVVDGPRMANESGEERTEKTNSDGVVSLAQLPAGPYVAAIRMPPRPVKMGNAAFVIGDMGGDTLEDSRVEFTVRSRETVEVQVLRPVLTTLSGMLTDASGPVARGKIELNRDRVADLVHSSLGGGYDAETDADGRFSIADIPAGDYVLSYGRRGQAVKAQDKITIQGEREVVRDLELQGGTIELTVIGDDGEPLRKAKVKVNAQGSGGDAPVRMSAISMVTIDGSGGGEQSMEFGGQPVVRTDEDGVARVEDVPPGAYEVEIEHTRHVAQTQADVQVRVGEVTSLGVIQLSAGGTIRGKVVDAEGGAPMIAVVELLRVGDVDPQITTAMRGGFRYTGLEPGKYRVRARESGGSDVPWGPSQEVEVTAGRTARVTAPLQ